MNLAQPERTLLIYTHSKALKDSVNCSFDVWKASRCFPRNPQLWEQFSQLVQQNGSPIMYLIDPGDPEDVGKANKESLSPGRGGRGGREVLIYMGPMVYRGR